MTPLDFRTDLLPLKDKIFRLGLRLTFNREEAEDLTQDTLIKVWNLRDELTEVKSLEAYCLTVCRNMALDRMARKEQSNVSLEAEEVDVIDNAFNPEEKAEHDDRLRRVEKIFETLPERLRTVLQLRDIEGMSYAEAASVMGITETLFKVTLHRARQAVKTQYEKMDDYGL